MYTTLYAAARLQSCSLTMALPVPYWWCCTFHPSSSSNVDCSQEKLWYCATRRRRWRLPRNVATGTSICSGWHSAEVLAHCRVETALVTGQRVSWSKNAVDWRCASSINRCSISCWSRALRQWVHSHRRVGSGDVTLPTVGKASKGSRVG